MKFQTLLISILFYNLAYAQFGKIEGTLYDSTNNYAYPYAKVQLTNNSIVIDSLTDKNGQFSFNHLPVGTYDIKFEYITIKDSIITGVKIFKDSITSLKINFHNPPCKYDNSIKNKKCPVCFKKNKVIPIRYGFSPESKHKKVYPGGCIITICDPNWFCERDSTKF